MKRKYFFFDIDGTLGLKLTKQLPADTAYCLKRLVQKGHFIAIATGRAQYDAAHVAKAYGIHSFVADGGNSLTLDGKSLSLSHYHSQPPRPFCENLKNKVFLGRLLRKTNRLCVPNTIALTSPGILILNNITVRMTLLIPFKPFTRFFSIALQLCRTYTASPSFLI